MQRKYKDIQQQNSSNKPSFKPKLDTLSTPAKTPESFIVTVLIATPHPQALLREASKLY